MAPAPQSAATQSLMQTSTALRATKKSIDTAKQPLEQLEVQISLLKTSYITPGRVLCADIESACRSLATIVGICTLLGPVPFVGWFVSKVANQIDKLGIDKQVAGRRDQEDDGILPLPLGQRRQSQ